MYTLSVFRNRRKKKWNYGPGKSSAFSGLPGAICGSCFSLILALFGGFFSGFSGSPASLKPAPPNSNATRKEDPYENQLRMTWLPL